MWLICSMTLSIDWLPLDRLLAGLPQAGSPPNAVSDMLFYGSHCKTVRICNFWTILIAAMVSEIL